MGCLFTRQAVADLEMIGDYIARDNPKRAVSFIQEIRQHCEDIVTTPHAYPLAPEFGKDIRKLPHGNYLILYTVTNTHVVIVHIVHGAKRIQRIIDVREE